MPARDDLVASWKRRLGLRGWKITPLPRSDRPLPSTNTAFSENEFSTKTAKIWADSEREVVHELLHLLTESLDDCFWRTAAPKKMRSLFARREEQLVLRLERAFLKSIPKRP